MRFELGYEFAKVAPPGYGLVEQASLRYGNIPGLVARAQLEYLLRERRRRQFLLQHFLYGMVERQHSDAGAQQQYLAVALEQATEWTVPATRRGRQMVALD